MTDKERFDVWAVFEQVGRNKYPARVTVETLAGDEVYRLDVPDGDKMVTTWVGSGTMYAIRPTTEEVVRRLAAQWSKPMPCQPWELPPKAVEAPEVGNEVADAWHREDVF